MIQCIKPFEDPEATFVRSISYRSTNSSRLETLCASINDLKKEITKREAQKKEMADVVDQDNLTEIKGRRPHRLQDCFLRPALDGKRQPGEVELHQNGLRYQSLGAQKMGKHDLRQWYHLSLVQIYCIQISSTSFSSLATMSYW
jgi:nucleosome binding factor SPN SPT16 subunit